MSQKPLVAAFLFCLCVTNAGGEGPAETDAKLNQKDQSLMDEISLLRKQMGGSVLKDSLLGNQDNPMANDEADFQAGIKAILEKGLAAPATSASNNLAPTSVKCQAEVCDCEAVRSLRLNSAKLDRIANDMELLRKFDHADDLRETAHELRQLARRLDDQTPELN